MQNWKNYVNGERRSNKWKIFAKQLRDWWINGNSTNVSSRWWKLFIRIRSCGLLPNTPTELTTEALERGAAKLYEFVNERRKIARHEPSFLPGYEPQLVLSNHLIDIEYVPTKEMTMRRQAAQRQALVKSISMPKMIRRADFSDYYHEPDRNIALSKTMDFVAAYDQAPDQFHRGLYLTGSFGVGKTYLMGAMANELSQT